MDSLHIKHYITRTLCIHYLLSSALYADSLFSVRYIQIPYCQCVVCKFLQAEPTAEVDSVHAPADPAASPAEPHAAPPPAKTAPLAVHDAPTTSPGDASAPPAVAVPPIPTRAPAEAWASEGPTSTQHHVNTRTQQQHCKL